MSETAEAVANGPLKAEFMDAILTPGALSTRFQPIADVRGDRPEAWAVECLTYRAGDERFPDADTLFRGARRWSLEAEVDRACVATLLETVQRLDLRCHLFLNVHPETLRRDPRFAEFLALTATRCGVACARLTVEIVEHGRYLVDAALRAALAKLGALGVRIALDDFGAGVCDYQMLRECRPQYVKIDGHLIRAARRLPGERQLLASVTRAVGSSAAIIAEGIEDAIDVETAREMGIGLVQGYAIGRPVPGEALGPCRAVTTTTE